MTADILIPLVICVLGMLALGVLALDTATRLETAETHIIRLKDFATRLVKEEIDRQLEVDPSSMDLERALTTVELHRQTIEVLRADNIALTKALVAAQNALTAQPD